MCSFLNTTVSAHQRLQCLQFLPVIHAPSASSIVSSTVAALPFPLFCLDSSASASSSRRSPLKAESEEPTTVEDCPSPESGGGADEDSAVFTFSTARLGPEN